MIRIFAADEGFSLLEVIVATMILAMAFAVALPIFGEVPQRLQDTKQAAIKTRLATSVMEREIARADWASLPVTGEHEQWSWSLHGAAPGVDLATATSYPLELRVSVWTTAEPDKNVLTLERIVWVRTS